MRLASTTGTRSGQNSNKPPVPGTCPRQLVKTSDQLSVDQDVHVLALDGTDDLVAEKHLALLLGHGQEESDDRPRPEAPSEGTPRGVLHGTEFVIGGESELVLVNLFKRLVSGESFEDIRGLVTQGKLDADWDAVQDIDALPFPAWEAFNLDNYPGTFPHRTKRELPMVTGRGCPFKCVFCCRALGNNIRRRSVESVIAEIEHNIEHFGCEALSILDETFVLQKKWSDEFFAAMKEKGLNKIIKWGCSTRVSDTSPELFAQMREAGCYDIFFGMESADDETLKQIKKNITVREIRQTIKWCGPGRTHR